MEVDQLVEATGIKSKDVKETPKKRIREPKKCAWVFTWNNYPTEWEDKLGKLPDRAYMVAGKELAPTTGTPHIQGYLRFHNGVTLTWLTKRIAGAHFAMAKGTDKDQDYCKKDGDFISYGAPSQQGKRTDIIAMRNAVLSGMNAREIFEQVAVNQQGLKIMDRAFDLFEPPRDPSWGEFKVSWWYGPTATGKTSRARREYPDYYFHTGDTMQWQQGFDGHRGMIIDDLRDTTCTYVYLLKLCQAFPLGAPFKGGMRQMTAMHIIITSCYSPVDAYRHTTESKSQLYRRITDLAYFPVYGKWEDQKIDLFGNITDNTRSGLSQRS
nr:putative replication associated protein [Crucivirus sp.]